MLVVSLVLARYQVQGFRAVWPGTRAVLCYGSGVARYRTCAALLMVLGSVLCALWGWPGSWHVGV